MHLEEVFECFLYPRPCLFYSERLAIPILIILFASDRFALDSCSSHLSNLAFGCHVFGVFKDAYDIVHLTILECHTCISHERCRHITRHVIIGLLCSGKQELQRKTVDAVAFEVYRNFVVLEVYIIGHIHDATLQSFPHFE